MKQYILKTLPSDGKAYEGFQWALEVGATVKAPDWNPEPKCGGGLHGWLKGEGNGKIGYIEREGCLWLVLEAEEVVNIDNEKVKFPECKILFVGDRLGATKLLRSLCPDAQAIIGESIEVGDTQKCLVGDYGHATAGDYGHATAGDYGHATAGYEGHATAGKWGHATAGYKGHATAGIGGTIQIEHYKDNRYRQLVGYIGEEGLEPNVAYKVEDGKFVKV